MPTPGKSMHIGATKLHLFRAAAYTGDERWKDICPTAKTREEAIQAIRDYPTEIICGCSCIKNDDGSCSGVLED
jgi:hypothetical protein